MITVLQTIERTMGGNLITRYTRVRIFGILIFKKATVIHG